MDDRANAPKDPECRTFVDARRELLADAQRLVSFRRHLVQLKAEPDGFTLLDLVRHVGENTIALRDASGSDFLVSQANTCLTIDELRCALELVHAHGSM